MKVEKRNLKVGDIVRTEHGEVYCIMSLSSCGSDLDERYVLVLSNRGTLRSVHTDSIVSIVKHTDFVKELLKTMEWAILNGGC